MAPILSHSPSQDSYFHAPHLDTDLTTVLVVSTFMGFGLLLLMAAKLLFCDFAQNRRARKRVAVELSAGRVTNLEGGGGGGVPRPVRGPVRGRGDGRRGSLQPEGCRKEGQAQVAFLGVLRALRVVQSADALFPRAGAHGPPDYPSRGLRLHDRRGPRAVGPR